MTTQNDPKMSLRENAHFEKDGQHLWLNYFAIDIASNINQMRERLATLSNELGLSAHALNIRIFLAGLDTLELDIEQKTNSLAVETPYTARVKMLTSLRAERQKWAEWKEILDLMDGDRQEFTDWANSNGQAGIDKFFVHLDNHTLSFKPKDYKAWLDAYLSDYQEHHIEDIKKDMFSAGVVTTESEWSAVSTFASRQGYSGNGTSRGYWKK